MKSITAIRIGAAAGAIALAACSSPSDKSANTGATGSETAGTSAASMNAATGANVGATTTTTAGTKADTTHAANDSTKKAMTSGNPTGSSTTRPTKP